ncbi:hypothetical protein [Halobaculum gomorrense]|uniref:Uncharacterized protein n=1 Tax=Halobaculum gomorrense TaxID=43928 RepID=A0A1M5PNW9_9EURY|nr:hypothetical protein [Halobaculum gomorrense]SHH03457.1 hypothetical protein SAMN05443636_1685 [Halobaculum gomorrense]
MSLPGSGGVAVGGGSGGADRGPSTAATLRGAALSAAMLLAWAGVVTADRLGVAGGLAGAAANHLLFAGVACTAIAAAVPKFVAVWSGAPLRWGRPAVAAAPLVAVGTAGVAGGLLAGSMPALVAGGTALAAGLWALAASTTRTLAAVRPWDATERLLLAGTWSLATGSLLGLAVGAGRAGVPVLFGGVSALGAVTAHVTLMVVGGVLAVGYGGGFQLSAMLTGAPDSRVASGVERAVSIVHPVGAVLLAGGRLAAASGDATAGVATVAAVGGVAVGACAVAVGGVVSHRLATGGESSAATRRYWGAAIGFPLWGAVASTRWATAPLSRSAVLGGPVAQAALWGAVAFLVVGSLYHIGPFLVWLERYADRLGLEPVPDVADLYDGRVERLDAVALSVAVVALLVAGVGETASVAVPGWVGRLGAVAACGAAVGVARNLATVVREHAPWSPATLVRGGATDGQQ